MARGPDELLLRTDHNAFPDGWTTVRESSFQTRITTTTLTDDRNNYVPGVDGQRFLVNNLVEDAVTQPIALVLPWAAGLSVPRLYARQLGQVPLRALEPRLRVGRF